MKAVRRLLEILSLKCEGASALSSRELDEPLGPGDRVALNAHLLVCVACRRFRKQLQLIRSVLRQPRSEPEPQVLGLETLSQDAKARITEVLRRALEVETEGSGSSDS